VANWANIDALILSPGVPLHHPHPHPLVIRANNAGCEVIGDIEVLGRVASDANFIGITGTNGKSTTTALIGHILQMSGFNVEVGGNLGRPALDMEVLDNEGYYVLEMSSYQIDLTASLAFDIAILLNITPDHLERHGGMDGYVAAKKAIFKNQSDIHTAIVGIDSEPSREICDALQKSRNQRVIPISGCLPVSGGVYALDGVLIDNTQSQREQVMNLRDVKTLGGEHNWQNAAAAYATIRAIGLDVDTAVSCLSHYPGLVHRQEICETVEGVVFINDSKATNPDAAARALASFQNIYRIAGGQTKEGGFDPILPYLGNVRHAYLVGDGADEIHDIIGDQVSTTKSGTIDEAVAQAWQKAIDDGADNPVVMLSPACASFDQFINFEERGYHFKNCVSELRNAQRGVS
jgi:UDP-N-acetylmuramoylalanine--D-glutamate ligase